MLVPLTIKIILFIRFIKYIKYNIAVFLKLNFIKYCLKSV
jgi:hypothetical protein